MFRNLNSKWEDWTKLKFFPLNSRKSFSENFQKSIKKNGCDLLIRKIQQRFRNEEELGNFLNSDEIFPAEKSLLKQLISNARVICADLKAESYQKILADFLAFVFILGSLKGLYADIEFIWSRDLKAFRSLIVRPKGVLVDCPPTKFEVLIVYDEETDALCFSVLQNIEKYFTKKESVQKIASNQDRFNLLGRFNKMSESQHKSKMYKNKSDEAVRVCNSQEKNFRKLEAASQNGIFLDQLPIFGITILIILVVVIIVYIVVSI